MLWLASLIPGFSTVQRYLIVGAISVVAVGAVLGYAYYKGYQASDAKVDKANVEALGEKVKSDAKVDAKTDDEIQKELDRWAR